MSARWRNGLVVGKFSPLHLGHEYLIETALAACERVHVLSWCRPELPGCAAARRRRWLAARFPTARVLVVDAAGFPRLARRHGWPGRPELPFDDAPEQVQRELAAWLCDRALDTTVDAVFSSEAYGPGLAEVLGAWMRARRDPAHPGVVHVAVDPARRRVPISASAIRRDVHAARDFLAPEVRADFVQRIAVLGGESSGKTTLAASLAERLGTLWVPEYGRELWAVRGGRLVAEDYPHIARTQLAREAAACRQATRWLVCDTSPLTTWLYACDAGAGAGALAGLGRLAATHYAHTFLCAPDFPFVQDGTRRDAAFRAAQHAAYLAELRRHNMPFTLLGGSLPERLATALRALGAE